MSTAILTTESPDIQPDHNFVLLQQSSLPEEVPTGISPDACLATLALVEQKLVSLRGHVIAGCLQSRQPASYRELKRWTKGQAHWLSIHNEALVGVQDSMARVEKLRKALLEIPLQKGPTLPNTSIAYSP